MDSIVMIYLFWEMVGVSSYLLIGFWFNRPAAAAAAKKAFLVTRFGDLGFLGAILLIYVAVGTFDVAEIQELALAGAIGGTVRRAGDLAARYGGEELAIVLPGTDEKGAVQVAERVRAAIQNLRLYVTAQNLVTWTKYTGYDPEVNANFNNTTSFGIDYGVYPQSRTFTVGLNATL